MNLKDGIDCKGVHWISRRLSKKAVDATGMTFGRLTALEPILAKGKAHWLCQCECGNLIAVRYSNLNRGIATSCGCIRQINNEEHYLDIVGSHVNNYTVMSFEGMVKMPDGKTNRAYYKCKCDCGNEFVTQRMCITTGKTKSCGCAQLAAVNRSVEDRRKKISLIGKRFGKITVLRFSHVENMVAMYECLCDCGQTIISAGSNIKSGYVRSCGCVRSRGELHIQDILRGNDISYKKEYTFDDLRSDKWYLLRYDFGIFTDGKLTRLIEFDGPQHTKMQICFGGEESFKRCIKHDLLKNQYALDHNIPLIRIPYTKRDSMTLDDLLGTKYLIKGAA